MKTIKSFIFIALAALGLSLASCSLDLSPIDYYGANNFWTTEAQATGNLIAIMQQLRSKNFNHVIIYGELRGGAYSTLDASSDGCSMNYQYVRENNISATNYCISNFGGYWTILSNLNLFISKVTDADYFSEEDTKNYCLGMAYGMRAYIYFFLYKLYGGVPLRLTADVVEGNYDASTLYMARAECSEVVAQVKSDIETSMEYFGGETSFDFKDDSANAKYYWSPCATEMLAGEVYLWNSKVACGDQEADTSDLSTSKSYLLHVINNYGLALEDDFEDIFSAENKQNDEIILAFVFEETETTNTIPTYFTYNTSTGFTPGTAYTIDGSTFQDPLTVGNTCLTRYQANNALWYQYDADDTRRDGTFVTSWHDASATQLRGTFPKKYLGNVSDNTGFRACDGDQPLYRLAEAYLDLAEVYNMEANYDSCAFYINVIRERAYGDNWSESTYGYSAGSFLENEVAILHERDKEFFEEGRRWFDVIRMTVDPACGETDHLVFHDEGSIAYGLDLDNNDYRDISSSSWSAAKAIEISPILSTSYSYKTLWPVDASTLADDPLLEQTPGY